MINIFKVNGKKNIKLFILILILIQASAFLSGFLGMSNSISYQNLIKPPFSPPSFVFPIIWTILYFLMSISLYRVILKGINGTNIKKGLIYFFIQLGLNLIWTSIFFRFELYGLAFLDILLLVIFILLTIFEFLKIDKIAAYLLIPYVIWVSFAGVLNYYIWIAN